MIFLGKSGKARLKQIIDPIFMALSFDQLAVLLSEAASGIMPRSGLPNIAGNEDTA